MRKGVGGNKTREDHHDVSDQLYDSYAQGVKARQLARIVGEMELSDRERSFLKFAEAFDRHFVNQSEYENRSVQRSLDIAWEALSILPEDELVRIREEFIRKYLPKREK
jgi:V/A-type H+-transporting ATPase subunit B